jgi:poly(A) polymerase
MMEATIIERAQHPISRRDIDPNVLKVLYRLIGAGHVAYLVGGGVRDLMMGRQPKDFDVATSAHPQQVRELFRNSRLIGRRFRLVHVFFGPQNIEVATFRRRSEEIPESDDPLIRHDNTFGTAEEDAFRRDFTINALFYSPASFEVIDYVNGVADLEAGLIRTIGDPELRMREDPVRMIRAVRFAVKLGFEIEPTTYEAMQRHRGDLVKASAPRLVEETFRTLEIIGAERAFILMEQLGILELLLPLQSRPAAGNGAEQSAPVRILQALSEERRRGEVFSRAMLLAALYCPVQLAISHREDSANRFVLVDELRHRGFSKADTEHMRLLLDALMRMIKPSRVLRRLARRPYFADARRLFDLVAPIIDADRAAIDQALAEPKPGPPRADGGRRRRRHRGGRGRRRGRLRTGSAIAVAAHEDGVSSSAAGSTPDHAAAAAGIEVPASSKSAHEI